MLDIKNAALSFIKEKEVGFRHDRSRTVGSSELGQCARKTAYEKTLGRKGYDKGFTESLGFAERGNLLENHWTVPVISRAAKAIGAKLLHAGQSDQLSIVAEDAYASATPDGIFVNMPEGAFVHLKAPKVGPHVLFEAKSIDSRFNMSKLPKKHHIEQVNFAMGLVRAATKYRPTHAYLVYVNASDVTSMYEFVIPFHRGKFKQQLERARLIFAKAPEAIAPEGKINGHSDCRYCPFSTRCLGFAAWLPKDERALKSRDRSRVAKLASEVNEAKDGAERAAQEVRDREAKLKLALNKLGTKSVELGECSVTWKRAGGAETLDMQKVRKVLKRDGYDLKDFMKRNKPSEKLKIETHRA